MDQRRFIYLKCPVCKKMIRSFKFIQHVKRVHNQSSPTRPKESYLICFEHDPPQFLPLASVTSEQKKKFYHEHRNHMKNNFRVTPQKQTQMEHLMHFIPVSPPPHSFIPDSLPHTLMPQTTSTPQKEAPPAVPQQELSLSEILELDEPNDALVRAANALAEEEQRFLSEGIDLGQRIAQSEHPLFSIDQLNQGLNFIPTALENLDEEDVSVYLSQFLPQREAMTQTDSPVMTRVTQGIGPTHHHSVLGPPQRAVLDVGAPPQRAVLDVGAPPQRAVLNVGEQSQTQMGNHSIPTMNENAAEYVRAMHGLNQVTLRQLMSDREQLDQHVQRTRQLMIDRMRDLLDEIEHQPNTDQHLMLDHFQHLQQIQEQFIQKLAQENASIQIPLYQLWEHL